MTVKHELRSCPVCGTLTTVKVRRPNHVLHAVLTCMKRPVPARMLAVSTLCPWTRKPGVFGVVSLPAP